MRLLSRLPRNHRVHAEILAKTWKPVGKITTGQRRRKDAAPDTYEYMGMDVTATFTVVHPEADGHPQRTEVIQAPARAVRGFSTGLLRTKVSTLKRIRVRDQRAATVFMRDAQKRAFACEEDAKRAARRDVEAQRRATLDQEATVIHHRKAYARGRGRPPKKPEPGIDGPHWRIHYSVIEVADAVATK